MKKKQIGMYTVIVEDDGTLKMQAPTLLRPLIIEPKQAQELLYFLNETQGNTTTPSPSIIPIPNAPLPPSPSQVPVTPLVQTTPTTTEPATNPQETPSETAQRVIQEAIYNAQTQYPASLAPENRDRFVEQLTRNATLRPLMSQGKITYKQILLWVEQTLGTRL